MFVSVCHIAKYLLGSTLNNYPDLKKEEYSFIPSCSSGSSFMTPNIIIMKIFFVIQPVRLVS